MYVFMPTFVLLMLVNIKPLQSIGLLLIINNMDDNELNNGYYLLLYREISADRKLSFDKISDN